MDKIIIFLFFCTLTGLVWSSHSDDFITLEDVSDTALNGATHGGQALTFPGIAIFDCDRDGYEDIIYASLESGFNQLFLNNGDFTFKEVAKERGINTAFGSYDVIAFDFDNNGDIDIALTFVSESPLESKGLQFFYNTGNCHFEDRTDTILGSIPELWTGGSLSASDYDHDGDLDLFVGNIGSLGRTPSFIGGFGTIYRNELNKETGEFQFVILPRSGPPIPSYLQGICCSGFEDIDEDGWDDVVIGICAAPLGLGDATHLWRNDFSTGNTDNFIDVSQQYGLGTCNDVGRGPQFPMSISYGNLDDDNHFDLFTTNAGFGASPVMYRAKWRRNKFEGYEVVDVQGINNEQFAWGANFIDLDNDGKDDIITVGAVLPITNDGIVYQNKVNSRTCEYIFEQKQTLGLIKYSSSVVANGDFNNDGFRDIAVNTMCPLSATFQCTEESPLKLYKNLGNTDPNRYYLDVGLKGNGIGTNYYGVGSIIRVKIHHFHYDQIGKIRVGTDGGNTNSIFAHFGIVDRNTKKHRRDSKLLKTDIKATVCVDWMGKEQTKECFENISLNQRIILEQGQGKNVIY